jgi:hypothetical protein
MSKKKSSTSKFDDVDAIFGTLGGSSSASSESEAESLNAPTRNRAYSDDDYDTPRGLAPLSASAIANLLPNAGKSAKHLRVLEAKAQRVASNKTDDAAAVRRAGYAQTKTEARAWIPSIKKDRERRTTVYGGTNTPKVNEVQMSIAAITAETTRDDRVRKVKHDREDEENEDHNNNDDDDDDAVNVDGRVEEKPASKSEPVLSVLDKIAQLVQTRKEKARERSLEMKMKRWAKIKSKAFRKNTAKKKLHEKMDAEKQTGLSDSDADADEESQHTISRFAKAKVQIGREVYEQKIRGRALDGATTPPRNLEDMDIDLGADVLSDGSSADDDSEGASDEDVEGDDALIEDIAPRIEGDEPRALIMRKSNKDFSAAAAAAAAASAPKGSAKSASKSVAATAKTSRRHASSEDEAEGQDESKQSAFAAGPQEEGEQDLASLWLAPVVAADSSAKNSSNAGKAKNNKKGNKRSEPSADSDAEQQPGNSYNNYVILKSEQEVVQRITADVDTDFAKQVEDQEQEEAQHNASLFERLHRKGPLDVHIEHGWGDWIGEDEEENRASDAQNSGKEQNSKGVRNNGKNQGKGKKGTKSMPFEFAALNTTPGNGKDAKDLRPKHQLKQVVTSQRLNKAHLLTYAVPRLPFPFTHTAQYRLEMAQPVGREFNSLAAFQRATAPEVIVKTGANVIPAKRPRKM